jgi:hypothetical protein
MQDPARATSLYEVKSSSGDVDDFHTKDKFQLADQNGHEGYCTASPDQRVNIRVNLG